MLRYDPRDMAEVRVFHEGRFLCRAVCQELAGRPCRCATSSGPGAGAAASSARRSGSARRRSTPCWRLDAGRAEGTPAGGRPGRAGANGAGEAEAVLQ